MESQYPNWLGFNFSDQAICMAVYDSDGNPIGLTVKVGQEPIMMIPIVPIPEGAIRFDAEAPK